MRGFLESITFCGQVHPWQTGAVSSAIGEIVSYVESQVQGDNTCENGDSGRLGGKQEAMLS